MSQYMKTKPIDLEAAADLPELTPQQQEFVRHILAGKSASDAYRASYDCSRTQPNVIWVRASELRNNRNVAVWLSAARKARLGTAVLTIDQHKQELERLREIAVESGNIGAAVAAETARGKVAGHHIERVQEIPADPAETLKEIAQTSPELAAQLAQIHGIQWTVDDHATKH